MAIKDLEKRFGTIAVEKGYITLDQLLEAIDIQIREEMEEGKHRLLGTILFEHGLITILQIDDVLKRMGKERS
jgi:hypothetical protein